MVDLIVSEIIDLFNKHNVSRKDSIVLLDTLKTTLLLDYIKLDKFIEAQHKEEKEREEIEKIESSIHN